MVAPPEQQAKFRLASLPEGTREREIRGLMPDDENVNGEADVENESQIIEAISNLEIPLTGGEKIDINFDNCSRWKSNYDGSVLDILNKEDKDMSNKNFWGR